MFRSRRGAGLTLIELQIALVLVALSVALLYGALHSGIRSWRTGQAAMARSDELRVVADFLRRSLSQAYPLLLVDGTERRSVFTGRSDGITYAGELPAHVGPGGLFLISIDAAARAGRVQALEVRYRWSGSAAPPASVTIAEDLERIAFRYFGRQGDAPVPRWYARWDDPARLPRLVEISLKRVDARLPWPAIVVAVQAEAQARQPQQMMRAVRGGVGWP